MMGRFSGWTSESAYDATHRAPAKKKKGKAPVRAVNVRAYDAIIGIDPGTKTGIAVKSEGLLKIVSTEKAWRAHQIVREWAEYYNGNILVRVEDARQRQWFGDTGRERMKGAGSVERDCRIWEEMLTDLGIPFEMVHPKNVKATTAEQFKKITGCTVRTSIHAREAAWLII
ncbi:MAG: hypothetical protein KDC70_00350 [Saprospiraceae bacterium]|nr:hypothetical protein [Saprospiraceae bacterium]